ncbi:MAG: LPS export ABC transporter periplasmic protein LptC [Gammaproteobacteria bacterium]|nr:LPS export ABC transporter periplasmic protein LptC [Gammaproteobacteria bacterium]
MRLARITLVVIAGIVAIAAGWVYQSQTSIAISKQELEIPIGIDYYLSTVSYRAMDKNGKLHYALKTPYLQHFKRDDISRMDKPEMAIYRDNETWQAQANSAELLHRQNIVNLIDQVIIEKPGNKPVTINADKAVLDLGNNVYLFTNTRTVYYNESN